MNYEDIKTKEQLSEWMDKITYGYKGKTKYHTYEENDFNDVWYNEYLLSEPNDVIKSKIGNCWDQTELERYWFKSKNYEIKTLYEMVKLPYENPYPTHTFLVFKDNNKWYWFENADFKNRGIHEFNTIDDLINYQQEKYIELLKTFSIKDEELKNIILKEYEKPKSNISAKEFIEHVINSKDYKGE